MNCEVCGTELPHGAMFCGECGRAVWARTGSHHPDSGMPLAPTPVVQRASDTAIIDAPDLGDLASVPTGHSLEAGPKHAPLSQPAGFADFAQDLPADFDDLEPASEPPGAPELTPSTDEQPAIFEHESNTSAERSAAVASVPDPFPWGVRSAPSLAEAEAADLEQTLIVTRRDSGERFVLQFSTGESVTVSGSGLLGRNPVPQPGEYFDQLVSISDPGKSVSKTHLEFGQESAAFWVNDRFSANGSVVREPGMAPKRLAPGKRCRIVRGTRVDIGEQFFVVS